MNEILTCKYDKCKKYLLDPVLLSCSNNVCKYHVDELINEIDEEFTCFVCNQKHKKHKDSFIINTALVNIYNLNLHLNENEKNAVNSLDILNKNVCELEKITNDPENFIFEYISETRRKIDLDRERLIEEINAVSNDMLEKLKQFENECQRNLRNVEQMNNQCKEFLSKLSNEIAKCNEVMRIPNNHEEIIEKLIDDVERLSRETQVKFKNFKKKLLGDKQCFFNSINTKIDQKLFGEFYVGNGYFEIKSSILNHNQSFDLIKLCEFDLKKKFKLLYQASRDGFKTESFHSKCDNIPNTLTIIKVKGNSNIFGGFTTATWDKSEKYKYDPQAFVFSLINKDNYPLKINVTESDKAICCTENYGPAFGDGKEIIIRDDSDKNQRFISQFGKSYQNERYLFTSDEANSFFGGSQYFSIEEIEVYQVM